MTSLSNGFEAGKNILTRQITFSESRMKRFLNSTPDVGDEIRRDVTIVELHAFGNFDFICDGPFLFHGDHILLSDLFHSLANDVADLDVAVGRDGGGLHDLGGGGNGRGVRREEFEDTVDGGLGTSEKIHGL